MDILWAVFLGIIGIVVAAAVAGGVMAAVDGDDAATALLISGLAQVVLLAAAWYFGVRKYRSTWRTFGFRVPRGTGKFGAVLLAIFASLAIAAVYGAVLQALDLEENLPTTPFFTEESAVIVALGATLAVVVAPLVEETFFRGFVFGGLRRKVGGAAAAVVSAALFTLAHLDPMTFIPIFGIGLVLAWVYARTGSLWYAAMAHMGYNGVVVYFALLRGVMGG